MTTSETSPSQVSTPAEPAKRRQWLEIFSAILLSLATVASAWCAYQSTLWSGVQAFRLADASREGRESARQAIAGIQGRTFDAAMFIQFMEAKAEGNAQHEKFLYERFRPTAKCAVEAWLKTDPYSNPQAPISPFVMEEYALREDKEAREFAERGTLAADKAQYANQTSDGYVMLTVPFSAVLFFGGISGTLDVPWLRKTMLIAGAVVWAATIIVMARMPICMQ